LVALSSAHRAASLHRLQYPIAWPCARSLAQLAVYGAPASLQYNPNLSLWFTFTSPPHSSLSSIPSEYSSNTSLPRLQAPNAHALAGMELARVLQLVVDEAAAAPLSVSLSLRFSHSRSHLIPPPPFSQEPSGTAAVVKFVYGVADLAADRIVAWELFRLFKPYPSTARVSPASPHTPTSAPHSSSARR
jgi:hypothetical protein